jgi:hypothetical protein
MISINPINYRSSQGSWKEIATEFCQKVNSITSCDKLISVSGTLGNYDNSGIFIAYASSATIH